MKLLTTPTSPYGRVARAVILERNLSDQVAVEFVPTRTPDSPIWTFNPAGKVPSLVLDDGTVVTESKLVCSVLDTLHSDAPVVEDYTDPKELALEGLIVGFVDGMAVWIRELRRAENQRSPGIIQHEHDRAEHVMDALEAAVARLNQQLTYRQLLLAIMLEYMNNLLPPVDWPARWPKLATWANKYLSRPSLA